MDLSIREALDLLDVSEDELYRLVQRGMVPAYRMDGRIWFNRIELMEWALQKGYRVRYQVFGPQTSQSSQKDDLLSSALARGGVHDKLPGQERTAVLREVVARLQVPANVDRELVLDLLLSREALCSTGMGGGIALPHPRNPLVLGIQDPVVMVAYLEKPIPFGAPDSQPVHILLPLFSPTVHIHLQLLSRIAFLLHDAELRALLDQHASATDLFPCVCALEAKLAASAPTAHR